MNSTFARTRSAWSASHLCWLLLFGLPLSQTASALTQTSNPTTCVTVAGVNSDWTNPGNAVSSNNSYATVSLDDLQQSDYLQCTSYGFSIPAGATINGITVNIERNASAGGINDFAMRVVKGGVIGTTDRATATAYPNTDTYEAHGGAADLWGTTWTPADINAANFGAALAAIKPGTAGGARTISVDHMQITVDYTVPTLTIGNASVTEGNSGTANATFTVTLSPASASNVTFNYATSNGTATGGASCTAGIDYITASGSKTITAGATSTTIDVQVCGDTTYEADETFTVTLSSPSGAILGVPSAGTGTITNDDLPAPFAVYALDDQTWDDSSGNSYHGAVGGTGGTAPTFSNASPAVGTTTGTCGYRAFNRPDKTYIYLPTAFPNLGASGAAFTITAWIRTTDNTQSGQRILIDDEGIAGGAAGYGFSLGDGGTGMVRFFSRGTSSALILDTPNVIANNTWYFVSAVIDVPNKTKHIYVFNTAGTLLSHVQATWTEASFGSDNGVVSIGGETNASGENTGSFGFAGNIDEIRVYSNALTQTDLNLVRAITRTCPVDVVSPGLFNACEVTSPKCSPTALPTVTYALLADKTAGVAFALDGVALLSGGTLNSACSGSVQVDLVANASTGVALGAGNCPVSQTATIALGNKTFASGRVAIAGISVGTAYADVRVKYTYAGGVCGSAATVCSTDNFAITGVSGPQHVEFVHDGSALTCTPKAITVLGCTSSASCNGVPGNHYMAGSFAISPTAIAGAQWCADNLCATPLTSPATVNNGDVIYFRDTTAQLDRLGGTTTSATNSTVQCLNTSNSSFNATTACDLDFAASGFIVSLPSHTSCANSTLTVTAVRSNNSATVCVPMFRNRTRSETISFAYSNPTSGTLLPAVGGTAISTAGTSVSLSFDNSGIATPTFVYQDVGKLSITVTDAAASMTGSTSTLPIIAPANFAFSGTTAGPIGAGNAFSATVTALNSCATPVATPNFGKETVAESATISLGIRVAPTGTDDCINGPCSGTVSGSVTTPWAGGGATASNLRYSEVGQITLAATLTSASYLGSGLTTTGTSGTVGAFVPAYFDTTVTQGCATGSFTYSAQPFRVDVTARNAAGGTTVNYSNLASCAVCAKDVTLYDPAATTNFNSTNTIAATAFAKGVGSSSTVKYTLPTPPAAPAALTLRAIDASVTPSVSSSGHAEGAATIRFGRLHLSNTFGSERQSLPVTVSAMYYAGSPVGWAVNVADGCTKLPAAPFTAFGTNTTTNACYTAACTSNSDGGANSVWLHDVGGTLIAGAAAPSSASGTTLVSGVGTITLTAPTLAGTPTPGTLEFTLVAPSWLKSNSGRNGTPGNYDWNPMGRVTFGVYGPATNKRKFIYTKENY